MDMNEFNNQSKIYYGKVDIIINKINIFVYMKVLSESYTLMYREFWLKNWNEKKITICVD